MTAGRYRGVVLVGGGGHASVCLDVFASIGRHVVGYTSPRAEPLDAVHLGDDAVLQGLSPDDVEIFIAIGDNRLRRRLLRDATERGFSLVSATSVHAVVSPSATLGVGSIVMPGAVVNARARIGDGVIVNTSASVDHDCVVGDAVHIAPGCHLSGTATIKTGAFLGVGCSVIPGCTIGEWAIVGAGSTVIGDVTEHSTWVGVPARRQLR